MKNIGKLLMRLYGWKISGVFSDDLKPCVLVIAPHTSNFDFIIGRIALWSAGVKVRFLIKKDLFFFPLGLILRALGARPVYRGQANNSLIKQAVNLLHKEKNFCLVITPEGTRKLNKNWKKGYYFIAQKAGVQIVLGSLNYQKKVATIGPHFHPSGDYEKDFQIVKDFYKGVPGRYPEQCNFYIKE